MRSTPIFIPIERLDGTARIAGIAEGLCRKVAAGLGRGLMNVAMIVLVWHRIKHVEHRLAVLMDRLTRGLVWISVARPGEPAQRRETAVRPARGPAAMFVPRRFGWLMQLVPYEAANFAGQLRTVLAEPDMVALLREVPQAGRILRPLCWMLGVEAALLTPCAEVVAPDAGVATASAAEADTTGGDMGGSAANGLAMAGMPAGRSMAPWRGPGFLKPG